MWSIIFFIIKAYFVCVLIFTALIVLGVGFLFIACLFADEIPPCKGDCDKCEPITKQYCGKGDSNNLFLTT